MIEQREASGRSEPEDRFATIFYRSPVPLVITAIDDGRILDANDAYGLLVGYPREQLLGRTTVELGLWARPEQRREMVERFRRDSKVRQFETTLRTRDGEIRHVETSFEAAQLKGIDCFISTALDVTERRRVEEALTESERLFRHVARMTSDLFYTCLRGDDGFFRVQWLGGNAPRLFGIDNATLQSLGCWRGFVVDADLPLFDRSITGLKPGEFGKTELRIRHEDGSIRHVRSFAEVEIDQAGRDRLVGALEDITERILLKQQLEQQAHTDALTGLTNRGHFLELAEKELSRAKRYRFSVALAMLDLDYFKAINDAFGHKTGDRVLKKFADLCRESLRESDLLARLGGEEFVILFPETTREEAYEVAERIRTSVAADTLDSPHDEAIRFTTSIGITELAEEDPAIDALLSRADSALYEAKRSGRNRTPACPTAGPSGRRAVAPAPTFPPARRNLSSSAVTEPIQTGNPRSVASSPSACRRRTPKTTRNPIMKKVIQAAVVASLLASASAFAHHPAADIVDPEIYAMIDENVADTPHADLDFTDMGR